jgi:hypothetical protein
MSEKLSVEQIRQNTMEDLEIFLSQLTEASKVDLSIKYGKTPRFDRFDRFSGYKWTEPRVLTLIITIPPKDSELWVVVQA